MKIGPNIFTAIEMMYTNGIPVTLIIKVSDTVVYPSLAIILMVKIVPYILAGGKPKNLSVVPDCWIHESDKTVTNSPSGFSLKNAVYERTFVSGFKKVSELNSNEKLSTM